MAEGKNRRAIKWERERERCNIQKRLEDEETKTFLLLSSRLAEYTCLYICIMRVHSNTAIPLSKKKKRKKSANLMRDVGANRRRCRSEQTTPSAIVANRRRTVSPAPAVKKQKSEL